MATLSNTVLDLPINPIRFLTPIIEKKEKEGVSFYKLNIGQPDIDTDPEILNAIRKIVSKEDYKVIKYSSANGLYPTRKAWAEGYYEGVISPDGVVVTNGSSEGMLLAYYAMLNPGDSNLVFSPLYPNYEAYAHISGRRLVVLSRDVKQGYPLPPVEDIESAIVSDGKVKVVTLISPDNPTGYVYSEAEIESIYSLAEKYDIWVVVDEAYRDIRFNPETKPIFDVVRDKKNYMNRTLFLSTVSKEYSACGIRMGALCSTNLELIKGLTRLTMPRLSTNEIAQLAICEVLHKKRSERGKVMLEYKSRRDVVISALRKMGISVVEPQGALYVLPDMSTVGITDTFKFSKWLVEDYYVEMEDGSKKSIVVAPGSGFYPQTATFRSNSMIRIAYVLNSEDLEKAMDILAKAVEKYRKL